MEPIVFLLPLLFAGIAIGFLLIVLMEQLFIAPEWIWNVFQYKKSMSRENFRKEKIHACVFTFSAFSALVSLFIVFLLFQNII